MKGKKEQELITRLEPQALANGFELVDVELAGTGSGRILRVLIDKQGGVDIEDITKANTWVNEVVEAYEPFKGSYTLEVSSPGIDRPLRTPEHFARFVGQEARISTEPLDGRSNWTGILDGVDDKDGLGVLLVIEGKRQRLPFEKIKKAHLKAHIDFNRTME